MNYHNTTDDPSDGWSNHWSNGEQEESKELPESKHIDKIIDFAEQIAAEDEAEMKQFYEWEDYIKPLFKKHTGYDFRSNHTSFYRKEWQDWIEEKHIEFLRNKRNEK